MNGTDLFQSFFFIPYSIWTNNLQNLKCVSTAKYFPTLFKDACCRNVLAQQTSMNIRYVYGHIYDIYTSILVFTKLEPNMHSLYVEIFTVQYTVYTTLTYFLYISTQNFSKACNLECICVRLHQFNFFLSH